MTDHTTALARRIENERAITIEGLEQLDSLRMAIAELYETGLRIEFDPESHADWVDYLAVSAPSVLEGTAQGAAIGLGLGALFGHPKEGALIGGLLGAISGAERGAAQVRQGWRIRVVDRGGVPHALVQYLG